MKSIALQIGNSDNKLSQQEWAEFVSAMQEILSSHNLSFHFFGGPPNYVPYQNVMWVFSCPEDQISSVKKDVINVRMNYRQDSAAWLEGVAEFI